MTECNRGQPGKHGLVRALLALALAAVIALVATLGLLPAGRAGENDEAALLDTPGSLPLRFEPNHGQSASDVEFLARGEGYALFLTQGEAVPLLRPADDGNRDEAGGSQKAPPAVLRWSLAGPNPDVVATALTRLPGTVNYFKGNSPESWSTGIPTYARVMYREVYPGVDLVYYGSQGELEYDFIVAAGADPGIVSLRFDGAEATRLDAQGNLKLDVGSGEVELRTPLVYQEIGGKRHEIPGSYVLKGDGEVGFQVLAYDSRRPLVIDPVLAYSSYLGGGVGPESGLDIAVDSQGLAYVAGWTLSTDFPTQGGGGADNTPNGGRDAFVTVFDPSQSGAASLLYSTYLGGAGDDIAQGIAVSSDGIPYVVGYTSSTDFPTTPGAYQPQKAPQLGGYVDVFMTKLSTAGILYSTYLGGSWNEEGYGIAVDGAGNAYLSGRTEGPDFPVKNAYQPAKSGIFDAFVAKIDPSQSGEASLVYSTYLGGYSDENGESIAVDAAGNAYVTGDTMSFDAAVTPEYDGFPVLNALQPANAGGRDAFVTKLGPSGSALVYSTYLGGSLSENGTIYYGGIAVDSSGNAYVTGETQSADFPNTVGGPLPGPGSAFVTKLGPGGALVYSRFLGGSFTAAGTDIAADGDGKAYVTGHTSSSDFPTTADAYDATLNGPDAFVTKLDATGATVQYSTFLGGSGAEFSYGIAVSSGYAYVAGDTWSADFPVVNGAQPAFAGGFVDAFVARLLASLEPVSITVLETVSVTDAVLALPPASIVVLEAVTVSDSPRVLPPASIVVLESVAVGDSPLVLPPASIVVLESVAVGDLPRALLPVAIAVVEAVTVSDAPQAAQFVPTPTPTPAPTPTPTPIPTPTPTPTATPVPGTSGPGLWAMAVVLFLATIWGMTRLRRPPSLPGRTRRA